MVIGNDLLGQLLGDRSFFNETYLKAATWSRLLFTCIEQYKRKYILRYKNRRTNFYVYSTDGY
jgi:hypothetical protein